MSTKQPSVEDILRPIKNTSKWWFVVMGLALAGFGIWQLLFLWQTSEGLIVTGLSDWGSGAGVTWGLYIGLFIWWVGIAHGGIILSAAVRLLGMKRYQPVARLAELLTLAALLMAATMILVHLGRPDRMVWSVALNFPQTVLTSPLVWDVTVITLYFVLTATYIGLTLRYDVSRLRDELPRRLDPVYDMLTIGYSESEDPIVERMVWWLALAIIILAPLLLHGGVIPWLFQLMPSMPGWFDSIQGPQFLTIALSSALSGVIILSFFFRERYDWKHVLSDDMMRGLTLWLGFFVLLFVWLQLQQVITGTFHAPIGVGAVTSAMLSHPIYWYAIGGGVAVLGYIFAVSQLDRVWTPLRAVGAACVILSATLLEKVLFVVEGLEYAGFALYRDIPGSYTPSIVELSAFVGTISFIALFFLVVPKVVPVVELHAVEEAHDEEVEEE